MTSQTNRKRRRNDIDESPIQRRSTSGDVLLTQDQFSELITTLKTTREVMRKGTFTTCTNRYQGQRDRNTLERFIAATSTFKTAENITDPEALIGLSILLEDEAGT
jgi:hypothetical protein